MIDNFKYQTNIRHRVKQILWFTVQNILKSIVIPSLVRVFILRIFGAKIGNYCVIREDCFIKSPWLLELGDFVWIGRGSLIDNDERVKLGSNVCISQKCTILTGSHNYLCESFSYFGLPVTIDNNSWLCAHTLVLPGAEIGAHVVVMPGITIKGKVPMGVMVNSEIDFKMTNHPGLNP